MYPLAAAIIGKRFRSMPSMNASTVYAGSDGTGTVGVRRLCRRMVSRFSSSPRPAPGARSRSRYLYLYVLYSNTVQYSTVEEDAMTTLAARARGYFLVPLILISQSAVRAKINDPSCTGLLIGKGTIWWGYCITSRCPQPVRPDTVEVETSRGQCHCVKLGYPYAS